MGNFSGTWNVKVQTVKGDSFLKVADQLTIPDYKPGSAFPFTFEIVDPVGTISGSVTPEGDKYFEFAFQGPDNVPYKGCFCIADLSEWKMSGLIWRPGKLTPDDDMGTIVGISKG
jgi:hypothetical protein